MSYSDILRVKNLGKNLKRNRLYREIVKDGLVLYLDGRDFKNSPPTSLWMDRAKPNQITYTNIITNGDFSNGTTGWMSDMTTGFAVTNGVAYFLPTGQYGGITKTFPSITGHKYYVKSKIKTASGNFAIMMGASVAAHSSVNQWETLSVIYIAGGTTSTFALAESSATFLDVYADDVLIIALTATFGAGNEPTQAECDSLFAFTPTTATAMRGNNATPSGMAYTTASGSDGVGGVVFDGVNDQASIIRNTSIEPTAAITLECSIKLNAIISAQPNASSMLFQKYDFASYAGYGLFFDKISTMLIFRISINGVWKDCSFNASSLDITTKYHIVATYDGQYSRLYINNVLVTTSVLFGLPITQLITKNLCIGAYDSSTNFISGLTKLVRIYNRALTDSEILQNYNASR